jgi:parvulin-like peptidyl-prolyl isomerase
VLLAAAPLSAAVLEDVVARVNGKPLLLSEYRKNVKSVTESWMRGMPQLLREDEAVKEMRQKVLDQMVDDELLAQEGEKLGLKVYARELEKGIEEIQERNFRLDEATGKKRSDGEMKGALLEELKKEGLNEEQFQDRIRRQLLMRKVIEEKVRPTVKEPDDKALQAAYDKLKLVASGSTDVVKGMPEETGQAYLAFGMRMRDAVAERVRVSHLLVKTAPGAALVERNQALKRTEALRKKLVEGADFAETAMKESDDAESAPRGGDLGFILRGWMPSEFEKAAFALPVGEISEPVESKFGFHLIRVQEKKAKDSITFERFKGDIGQFLYNMQSQTALIDYLKKLRTAATLELKAPPAE